MFEPVNIEIFPLTYAINIGEEIVVISDDEHRSLLVNGVMDIIYVFLLRDLLLLAVSSLIVIANDTG